MGRDKIGGMKKSKSSSTSVPEWERRVRESFARQGFMKHIEAQVAALGPGHCEIRVPYQEKLTQQHGYFHGGVTAAIADSASGYAAYTLMPPDHSVLAVEFKINLLAPAEGDYLLARARVVRSGKTLKVCAVDVFGVKHGTEKLCATMLATVMALPGRSDFPQKGTEDGS